MKKIIALIMCVSVLGLTACGKAETEQTDTSAEASSTVSEAVTEQTAAETTAAETTERVTESETTFSETEAPVKEKTIDEIIAERGDTLLTIELFNKIAEYKDKNVEIEFTAEEDGAVAAVIINCLGDKVYAEINAADILSMITISDGQYVYMLDSKNKVYCKEESDVSASDETGLNDLLIDENSDFENTGVYKEAVDGVDYICEEFIVDNENMKYYFNADSEICGIGIKKDDGYQFVTFTVEFSEIADDSIFTISSDYKEVTADEYATYLLGDLLAEMQTE